MCPLVMDHFIGPAREIAFLRDRLHVARGGAFVDKEHCPDECNADACTHGGEPLNAAGSGSAFPVPIPDAYHRM